MKPTDKYYLKGVPFDGRTISKQAYLPLNLSSPSNKIEKHDSLKNLALWLGDSSYRSNYHPPMQRYYPKIEGRKVDQYRPSPDVSARFGKTILTQIRSIETNSTRNSRPSARPAISKNERPSKNIPEHAQFSCRWRLPRLKGRVRVNMPAEPADQ